MFKFLPATPRLNASRNAHENVVYKDDIFRSISPSRRSSTLLMTTLAGILFLTGCQQQSDTQPVAENTQPTEKTAAEDSQPMTKSDSAAARIEQFQPIYVAQAQGLQRRLQAEYESLQAADTSDSENLLLTDSVTETNNDDALSNDAGVDTDATVTSNTSEPATVNQTDWQRKKISIPVQKWASAI